MRNPLFALESILTRSPLASRWQPAADVYRTPEGWLLKIELAGVRRDEFAIRIAGHHLILQGRRRDWQIHEAGQCQSLEITYDEFERRFDFPVDLSEAEAEVEYSDGMLVVRLRVRRTP
jgi:HSP20 family protein